MDPLPVAPAPVRLRRSFFAKDRPWLNAGLFLLTIGSVFLMGLSWSSNFLYAEKFALDPNDQEGLGPLADSRVVGLSLIYAFVLMAILSAHELGHYLMCRRYGLSATLPFFIPAPTLIGTLGAFIKIRSPITQKHRLFDVGAAGPLAGFCLAVPALMIGLALSKLMPSNPQAESLVFGEPLLLRLAGSFLLKGAGPGLDVILHPVAFAGWVGILVTALNLLPLGQLDGGHIAYAVFGPRTKSVSKFVLGALLAMGLIFWVGWLIWFFLLLIMGLKHPRVWDEVTPLDRKRKVVAVAMAVIFVLSFIPAPIRGYNVLQMVRTIWP